MAKMKTSSMPGVSKASHNLVQIFLTIREVAKRLAVSTRSVHRLIAAGDLPTHRFGKSVRVSELDMERYIASCRRG